MAASEPRRITDLETYLCRSFGLALLILSLLTLILTGVLPLTTASSRAETSTTASTSDAKSYPVLIITTIYHALTAFYLYTQLTYSWNFAFTCGIIGSTGLFGLGMWVAMFGDGKARVSKSTGADKRTSGYPFKNEESAREKKREKEGKGRKSVLRSRSYKD